MCMYVSHVVLVITIRNWPSSDDVHCTWINAQTTMYKLQCTIYNVQSTMYNLQCTMYIVQSTMHNVQQILKGCNHVHFNFHTRLLEVARFIVVPNYISPPDNHVLHVEI